MAVIALVVSLATGCGSGSPEPAAPVPAAPRVESPSAPSRYTVETESPVPRPAEDARPASPEPAPEERSHILVRRTDPRPMHDDARLAEQGIHAYESRRLKLYTDIGPEIARTLPPIVDAAYEAWESYFGPLPPDRERTEYRITGYLMADQELFRAAGLLPEDLPRFRHGRHWYSEFWMNDQEYDYYRRHLLIHEATHCFMTALRNMTDVPPVWYMEGMAELFGTHTWSPGAEPPVRFRVMPHNKNNFGGFGRITKIREEIAAGARLALDDVLHLRMREFLQDSAYAWSWGLCYFLDTHPRYRDRFRQLGDCITYRSFLQTFRELFTADLPEMRTEWALFAENIQEGYDVERAAIEFRPGSPLTGPGDRRTATISADRGWQSSGVLVEQGSGYRISASGRFTLAQEPKPWVGEPQGISFRYFGGRPLGELQAAVRAAEPSADGMERMLDVTHVGREAVFHAPVTGTLYLRLNDSWSELADNAGSVQVTIERLDASAAMPADRPSPQRN